MMSDRRAHQVIPLLFTKRRRAAPATAAQYVGTDTELDPKDAGQRLLEQQSDDLQLDDLQLSEIAQLKP